MSREIKIEFFRNKIFIRPPDDPRQAKQFVEGNKNNVTDKIKFCSLII